MSIRVAASPLHARSWADVASRRIVKIAPSVPPPLAQAERAEADAPGAERGQQQQQQQQQQTTQAVAATDFAVAAENQNIDNVALHASADQQTHEHADEQQEQQEARAPPTPPPSPRDSDIDDSDEFGDTQDMLPQSLLADNFCAHGEAQQQQQQQADVVFSGDVFHVPLYSALLVCFPCNGNNAMGQDAFGCADYYGFGANEAAVRAVGCVVPPLGDRMCDLFVCAPSDLLDVVSRATFGAVSDAQARVWFDWPASALERVNGNALRLHSPLLQTVPMGTRTDVAVNVHFSTPVDAVRAQTVHVIVRQQYALRPDAHYVHVHANRLFYVERHAGYVWMSEMTHPRSAQDAWPMMQSPLSLRLLPPDIQMMRPAHASVANTNAALISSLLRPMQASIDDDELSALGWQPVL